MDALHHAVKTQLDFVNQVKTGGAGISFAVEDLGIDILLANIAGIKPVGKTGDAADQVAVATQAALVNDIGAENLRRAIEATRPIVGGDHKLATEIEMLRRGLETKTATEQQFGLSPEIVAAAERILTAFAALKRRTK
jgi:hypothetical protein